MVNKIINKETSINHMHNQNQNIQSHGALLALDSGWEVTHHSENICSFRKPLSENLQSIKLEDVFANDTIHTLRNKLQNISNQSLVTYCQGIPSKNRKKAIDIAIHRTKSSIIIEFEYSNEDTSFNDFEQAILLSNRLFATTTIDEITSLALRHIFSLSLFEGALLYKQSEINSMNAVYEFKKNGIKSLINEVYIGKNIPSSFQLSSEYCKLYTVQNINDTPNQIVCVKQDYTGHLDLSKSHLSCLNAADIHYFQGIDIKSLMFIPLVVNKCFWGMVMCYSSCVKKVSLSKRLSIDMYTKMLCLLLEKFISGNTQYASSNNIFSNYSSEVVLSTGRNSTTSM
jgi:light-regulated signal transduction histidine kinase (bacteriophytochrome)